MDWILYMPQYHFAMGIVGLACLVLCVGTFVIVRRIWAAVKGKKDVS